MTFVINHVSNATKYWLTGDTWTTFRERADVYATKEEAEAVLTQTGRFMAPFIRTACRVQPA